MNKKMFRFPECSYSFRQLERKLPQCYHNSVSIVRINLVLTYSIECIEAHNHRIECVDPTLTH